MSEITNFSETFIQEAEDLIVEIEERILDLETDPEDRDAIDGLFRAMHTIKGSGAMFGFDDIAGFTHHVETALDAVRAGRLTVDKSLIDLTLASRDQIKSMLDEAKGGGAASREEAQRIIDAFSSLYPEDASSSRPDRDQRPRQVEQRENTYRIRFKPSPAIFSSGMDPILLVEELSGLGECVVTTLTDDIPELEFMEPEQCYVSIVAILTTRRGIDAIRDVFIFVEDASTLDIVRIDIESEDEVPKIGDILVERGDATRYSISTALSKQSRLGDILLSQGDVSQDQVHSALVEQRVLRKKQEASLKETIRVPADKLDRLINLVGELVITQAQLHSAAAAINRLELSTPVEEMGRLTTELRDIALNVRMMPIGSTFNRFRRLVRDLSQELGKQIELETLGAETEMDKTVIERMGDLLVHLIRNSIDHGIEPPETRVKNGKPPVGTIRLTARHEGAKVVISIEDDGKGIDPEVVRAKAVERGIIGQETSLSQQEMLALVMAPGFSTAESVSNISGRGVGMDVVKKEITALRGEVSIASTKGNGTHVLLSLPLTLAIIDGLLVRVGAARYIIPVAMVAECLELTKENQSANESRNLLVVRDNYIPFVRLRDVFEIDAPRPALEEAVIVEIGDSLVGVVVDHIIGDHQTVIKSLGRVYRNAVGVSGATILGDGTVALIADVPSILRIANRQEQAQIAAVSGAYLLSPSLH